MKLLLSFEFPFRAQGYGGGHHLIRGLSRELVRAGHEVHICGSGRDEVGAAREDAPVQYHLTGRTSRWRGFDVAQKTLRLVRQLRPGLVCCFTSEAAMVVPICNAMGVPTLFYLAAPELPSFRIGGWSGVKRLRYQFDLFMHFLGARAAGRVFSVSDFLARQAQRNWEIPAERIEIMGMGLGRPFLREHHGNGTQPANDPPRLISVGRLALAQKPLDRMAEALAGMQSAWQSWTIVGTGNDERVLRARIEQLGIAGKTHFVGLKTPVQIVELFDTHDLVLLPSTHESFFMTVYEAAAQGKVIVTNDVAEIRQAFAADPSVIIARDASAAAYRESIHQALANFSTLQAQACAIAERVRQEHAWSTVAKNFLQSLS